MDRPGEGAPFAPLPGDEDSTNPRLADIDGLPPATVAVLEEGGYQTLDDIIDLEREDFLKLAGIGPEEADRLVAFINELTTDDDSSDEEDSVDEGGSVEEDGEEPPQS